MLFFIKQVVHACTKICYPRLLVTFTHFHERSGTKFVIRMCKAMVPHPPFWWYIYAGGGAVLL